MASTSSSADSGIIEAAGCGDIGKLKKIREEIGDEGKFRRMCDSVTDSLGLKVLHAAAGMGESDTCKFLVEEVGVDIDVKTHRGNTPLLTAMTREHLDIAKYLIEQGADITATDSKLFTALHYCIPNDDTEIMNLLLTKGADIEADSVGGTPLHCAAKFGNVGLVNFLLQNKAEPNSVSKYLRIPPLVCAIYSITNTVECVELLLKAKADPNKASNGSSPLAHAVDAKANSCIDCLLAAGADVDSISSCDLRPIEHAALANNVEAVWMLILARPRILATPNWSFLRFMYSVNTSQAIKRRYLHSKIFKQKGDGAWDKKDYSCAIASYSEAIHQSPCDGELLANRSLCWARKGEGAFALRDAEKCVELRPDWGKAHLREAIAWHLLERNHMSLDAFKRAYELSPENEKIERDDEMDALAQVNLLGWGFGFT